MRRQWQDRDSGDPRDTFQPRYFAHHGLGARDDTVGHDSGGAGLAGGGGGGGWVVGLEDDHLGMQRVHAACVGVCG